MQFLKKEVESEHERKIADDNFGLTEKDKKSSQKSGQDKKSKVGAKETKVDCSTAAALHSGHGQAPSCIFCEKSHVSEQCGKATTMTIVEKEERIKSKNACFSCLKKGHGSRNCKAFLKCPVCTKKHHALLCPELKINQKQKSHQEQKTEQVVAANLNCTNAVLLKTLVVRAIGQVNQMDVRVLLDEGSQRSYIREEIARMLKLKPIGTEMMQKSLFGGQKSEVRLHKKYLITLESLKGPKTITIPVIDEPTLCGKIPRVPQGPWIQELKKMRIKISDLVSDSSAIDIVIGSDHWGEIVCFNGIRLRCGLLAMETTLGWTLSGPLPREENVAMNVTSALFVENVPVADLCELETIGIKDPIQAYTKEEKERMVADHFSQTVKRTDDGRYSVCLPWIEGQRQEIPSNRSVAEKRLLSTTHKLQATGFYQKYQHVFDSWKEEGIIEEVQDDCETKSHFLPHRAVIKPESLTTPVRPVFDASCKTGRNPSLNECLEKGPNLMEMIPSILLRFREKKIGISSDIRKAFQMIEVDEMDRRFLRFLWWEDSTCKKLKLYKHKRVVFGVNCSPFLLQAVLQRHLSQVKDEDKEISTKFLHSLYVDNCLTSVDTVPEYQNFREKATMILEEAKMELRQWVRTGDASRVGFSIDEGCGLEAASNSGQTNLVLRLIWDNAEDFLSLDFQVDQLPAKITKRLLLSSVNRIFDPIGFACPATLLPKILLQELWTSKLGWDEEIPPEVEQKFRKWAKELESLKEIRIPRHLVNATEENGIQIHTFGDASQSAYAGVVFVRNVTNGKIEVNLAQAKARVSPLKKGTIPRLELMAGLISARLTKSTKEALGLKNVQTFFWSDSTTTLSWIRRNDDWGTFVGNRVREILVHTQAEQWRYVPGTMNPADLPSRGCSPAQLLESRWWEGPDWLKRPSSEWPSQEADVDEEEVLKERKKTTAAMVSSEIPVVSFFQTKFASYSENVRVLAFIQRFIDQVRKKNLHHSTTIQIEEFRNAEAKLLKIIQSQSFPDEVSQVGGISVTKLDDGLLHVKSRLLNKDDSSLFKLPILLPNNHPLVEAMILEIHLQHGHIGVQCVLGKTRERFWIIQGRRTVRRILRKCITCRRHQSKPLDVDPAALPEKRVSLSAAFETTGVDLAGPLFVKDGSKKWIVIFTCAVYRGSHLELISSLSTEAFLDSLERFVNLFGRPSTVYSDNGTNFVGAVNLFKKLNWEKIERLSQVRQIRWIFNPPTAAWWGGWWERLIRIIKDQLKRMLGNAKLSEEKLRTCLSSVEAALNDRPLTTLTEDPDDLTPLTPSMFLRGSLNRGFPEGHEITSKELREDYKVAVKLHNELKDRFRREYLAALVQRAKEKKTLTPRVGYIVLIGADNKKRLEWPMGRILELIPGRDGQVRVAKVKTKLGIWTRPLQRLYPMEVPHLEESPFVVLKKKKAAVDNTSKKVKATVIHQPIIPVVITRAGRVVTKPERFQN